MYTARRLKGGNARTMEGRRKEGTGEAPRATNFFGPKTSGTQARKGDGT